MQEIFAPPRERELLRVSYLLQHPEMVRTWGNRLSERHFEYVPARFLFLLISDAVKRHGECPTMVEMLVRVETSLETLKLENSISSQLLQDVREVYETHASGTTGDDIAEWIAAREIQDLGRDMSVLSADQVANRLPEIRAHMDKLQGLAAARSDVDLGIDLFGRETLDNLEEFVDKADGVPIPLGYPRLDSRLNGGLRAEEMMLIACESGVGKSLMLFNMLLGCVLQNLDMRAAYYSIGDARDGEMALRMLACASQVPLDQEKPNQEAWDKYRDTLERRVGGVNSRLRIKQFAPHRITPQDLQRHIRALKDFHRKRDLAAGMREEDAGKLHLIGIDYPDLMLLEQQRGNMPEHERLKRVLEECLAVCKDEKVAGIAVTQVNAFGYKSEDPNPTQLQGALAKIDCVSHLFFYKQSPEEEELGRSRLYNWKSRRLQKKYVLPMKVNIRTQTITEDLDREPWSLAGERRKRKGGDSATPTASATIGTPTNEERMANFEARVHASYGGKRSADSPLNALPG